MKNFIVSAIVVLTIIMGIVFIFQEVVYISMKLAPQENDLRVRKTVKAVCDYSHNTDSSGSEEACGIAQDTSGIIYDCKDPLNIDSCYVEKQ